MQAVQNNVVNFRAIQSAQGVNNNNIRVAPMPINNNADDMFMYQMVEQQKAAKEKKVVTIGIRRIQLRNLVSQQDF